MLCSAELSHPKQGLAKEACEKSSKTQGQKCLHAHKPGICMKWKALHIWQQINAAFKVADHNKLQTDILRILISKNPDMFVGLRPQQITKWIKQLLSSQPCWKASVLEQVGYSPGGKETQTGILVRLSLQICTITSSSWVYFSPTTLSLSRRSSPSFASFALQVYLSLWYSFAALFWVSFATSHQRSFMLSSGRTAHSPSALKLSYGSF
jgi:hypothetical protein